jgi:type IV pilus assembly protein PilF
MNTLRSAWLYATLVALTACANSGSMNQRASANEAAVANMNLGAGYLRQGNTELAIERLRRALSQDPRLVDAHSTIAVAYDQIGKVEEAETHYSRAAQLDPDNGGAANAYAVFLCRQNRYTEAEPFFRRAADNATYTTPEVALTNAGVCARDSGQLDAAAENFRLALTRNPSYPDALLNMMELSYQSGNYLQARAFVQRYIQAQPATAAVLWTCFNVERELKDDAAAERCATQLRNGFQGTPELAQLEEQQRRDGR